MTKLQVDKVEDLISHVKSRSGELVSKGANEKDLKEHIEGLEAEMKKPALDHGAISNLLASLETTIEKAEESMVSKGVFQLLNQILGTGVPNP